MIPDTEKQMEIKEQHSGQGMKVIVSGGGTGGHVFPAIAIANELKNSFPGIDILFVGAKGKIEMEKVPKAGYPIIGLWISGFHRKLTLRNLLFPLKLLVSLVKSWFILNRFKPDVVVGVGGFASGPILEVASRKNIPTIIQEQNSYAGVTNRLLAKKVDRICVAYDGMDRYFPEDRIVLTGNPVRKDFQKQVSSQVDALRHFGLDSQKKTILVFGGSLGAKSINEAMAANSALIEENSDTQILWQVGKLYIDQYQSVETATLNNVVVVPFIDRMDLAYKAADIVISRAGALAIAELCTVGKPTILIPSPNVAEDHQTKNAQALVKERAAILVKDKDGKENIIKEALQLLSNVALQEQLSKNIKALAKPNAAELIANEVIQLIKK